MDGPETLTTTLRSTPNRGYRPLSDYGLIGNTHTAALVGRDGSIDWCCLPHFDSGAVFCRLLDARQGGFFRIGPQSEHTNTRRYVDGTAVLETCFQTADAQMRLTDFMHAPRLAQSRLDVDTPRCHRLLRRIEGLAGRMAVEIVLKPTFDFARAPARLSRVPAGVVATSGGERVELRVPPAIAFTLDDTASTASARFVVKAGDTIWVTLAYANTTIGNAALAADDPEALLNETLGHWLEWDRQCTYEGPYEAQVRASARVLKLLTFGPTGALVAAPTTSLPECIGGVRNWDYRFCWLRDSALVLHALMSIGYYRAAMDFFEWLSRLCKDDGKCMQPRIMYRLNGRHDLPEHVLSHLSGYLDSKPVRIGNAAVEQRQLDVYGHVLDAAHMCLTYMKHRPDAALSRTLRFLADLAAQYWRAPDQGLWEARSAPRHHVSSKLMCWVALDRAVRLAELGEIEGDVGVWRREREAIRNAILQHGYDARIQAFTQAFDSSELDASALLISIVGFLPANDPRMVSTIERIREQLVSGGLVYRYQNHDGLPRGEGTFAICTYWLVDNLAMLGRLDEACAMFEHVSAFANDLGLLSEEIDPTNGGLLGNYPQGFTHLALIQSALGIQAARDARIR
ncbi:MAG TPA: glycoside hydrolase family 15 protein [Burkholderiaceae bacterium]|nr:glycoside hydrolase family 15 protein [Burkholderiaceae bacterium]